MALAPPVNFAMVSPGIYRSGFPTRHSAPFLQQLGLRSIVNLAETPGLEHSGEHSLEAWIEEQSILVTTCNVIASCEPFVVPDHDEIRAALRVLLDQSRHPVLIHSLRGDGPVGVVIAILRRLQQWSLTAVFDEHRRFCTHEGTHLLDLQTIEVFDITRLDPTEPEPEAAPAAVPPKPKETQQPERPRSAETVLMSGWEGWDGD